MTYAEQVTAIRDQISVMELALQKIEDELTNGVTASDDYIDYLFTDYIAYRAEQVGKLAKSGR